MTLDLLAIRDTQVTNCSCGNRVFAGRSCPVCILLLAETVREAS